jgi:hypothetical protein
MTNLSGWTESSAIGAAEAGESTGGIRVTGDVVQLNSWWDAANWMTISASSGVVIQDEKIYTLEVQMQSYNSGAAVMTKMTNVSSGSSTIVQASHNPSSSSVQPYTISFSTVGSANSSAVGDVLGVVVDAGWWNNMAVAHVSIDEDTSHYLAFSPTPGHDIQPTDNVNEVGFMGDAGVDIQLSWNTMLDTGNPSQPEPDVTKHYLYVKENSSDFSGVTPVEISAGSPVDPVASYLAEDLNYSSVYYWRVDESINDSSPGSASTVTGPVWAFETTPYPTDNNVTIDSGITYQTFEGFGVGTMDQNIPYWYTTWSSAVLEKFLDAMYTLDNNGLGLEITRVPMPVGDDPSHAHMWAYSNMGLRSPEAFETADGVFDWSNPEHQEILWHIQGAAARGVRMWAYWHGVPHWMSVSGCSAGSDNGTDNNLIAGKEGRFAEHMCDVLEHFRDSWGVDFEFVGAINEPDEDWWKSGGNQPGCRVTSSQAVTIHQALQDEMDARGLTQKMVAPDSFSSANDHNLSYLDTLLTSSVGPDVDVISCHQYYVTDDGMAKWYWRSVDYNTSLWMSEWGDWNNLGFEEAEVLAQARNYANKIQQGLKDLNATGYIFWEQGLMLDTLATDFNVRKSYWVAAQFSRHVRSGMKLVYSEESDPDCKTTVWVDTVDDPSGKVIPIVKRRYGSILSTIRRGKCW